MRPPALTLGLEPIRPDLLKHKPTRRNENIISKKMLLRIFVNGIFISVIFMLQHFKNFLGAAPEEEATVLFTLFVLFQLFNAFNCRELDDTPMFKNSSEEQADAWCVPSGIDPSGNHHAVWGSSI